METKKFHLMTLSTNCSVPLFSTCVDAVSPGGRVNICVSSISALSV